MTAREPPRPICRLSRPPAPARRGGFGGPLLKMIAQRIALGVLLLWAVSVLIFAGTRDPAGRRRHRHARPDGDAGSRRQHPQGARPRSAGGRPLLRLARRRACRATSARATRTARTSRRTSASGSATRSSLPSAAAVDRGAARHRPRRCSRCATATRCFDRFISIVTLSAISLPEFFAGYLLILLFAVQAPLVSEHRRRSAAR